MGGVTVDPSKATPWVSTIVFTGYRIGYQWYR
jgi:hypothetical protein